MSRKIIGVTVGTPTSASRIADEIKPVKTVNGNAPDENGNVKVPTFTESDKSEMVERVIAALPKYKGEAVDV